MAEEEIRLVRRGRPRLRMVALLVLLLVILLIVVAWTQRKTIATGFIDRELARRGVEARYEIASLGAWTQRLENVVIGDPAHPDLTARSVRVELSLGFRKPRVSRIVARGVRINGRLIDGRLSLGQIDRLLPPPSGAPFALPDLAVEIADTGLSLVTAAGNLGIAIEGHGNLSGGFSGRMAIASRRLASGSCIIAHPRALLAVSVSVRRPSFDGRVHADRADCGSDLAVLRPVADVDATLAPALDIWLGRAELAAASLNGGAGRLEGVAARLSYAGGARLTKGSVRLTAAGGLAAGLAGRGLVADGDYSLSAERGSGSFEGAVEAARVQAGESSLRTIRTTIDAFAGTPLEPIGKGLAAAAARAARDFAVRSRITLATTGSAGSVRLSDLSLVSRTGAQLALADGSGLGYGWPDGRLRLAGSFSLDGGGFPAARGELAQAADGGLSGTLRVAPFASGAARLALSPISFAPGPAGTTLIRGHARIDGPLGGGQVSGLAVPLVGRIGNGGFVFGEGCTTASFRAFRLASLALGPTRLPLCPVERAILWKGAGGGVRGGAMLKDLHLAGQLGASPFSFAPARLRFTLADSAFVADRIAIRLGTAPSVQRLDLERLGGRFVRNGVAGTFAGADAKLANVPLLLRDGAGSWQFVGDTAIVDASLTVADEAEPSRFHPLESRDFHLTLTGSRIDAGGWLHDPQTGTQVAHATITHALDSGRGHALLDVPGIRFGPDYQPEELTRLTTGVVALVNGVIHGSGQIDWSPEGTASSGTFATEKMNLAAPFGPVTGLTTTIHFSDLLGLATPPGQLATTERIQAGIDVFDGRVRYQLLPGLRVKVESAEWPFAGGRLALEETILDFSKPTDKHLTFRVSGMDAAAFVQQMEFSNISATGTFDGVVPMVFGVRGGRVVGGHLEARPDGGVVSYVGELSDQQLGAYGKLAFDALKSLRYSKLKVDLDGSLEGEFVAGVELDGIARNAPSPTGLAGAALNQLAKIPFEFNITARGPFRALIGTMRSLEDPSALIESALAAQMPGVQPGRTNVQVQESEDKP
jgi:hypothetical protein